MTVPARRVRTRATPGRRAASGVAVKGPLMLSVSYETFGSFFTDTVTVVERPAAEVTPSFNL
jgi:hypothetical protein